MVGKTEVEGLRRGGGWALAWQNIPAIIQFGEDVARSGDTGAPRRLDESIARPGQAQIFKAIEETGKRGRVFTECFLFFFTTLIRCDEVVM